MDIYIIKTQLMFVCVCLPGLYYRDGGIKTALIIDYR